MFHKGYFVWRLFGTLLLIAALIGGGFLLFRAGQAQGYALGLAAAGKELSAPGTAPVAPHMPFYGYGYGYGYPHPFFMPFGFFGFGLSLLFFFLIVSGIARLFFWRRHPMWHEGYGPQGPWAGGPQKWGPPGDPQAEQPKPTESK